jgi:hypothetical protein
LSTEEILEFKKYEHAVKVGILAAAQPFFCKKCERVHYPGKDRYLNHAEYMGFPKTYVVKGTEEFIRDQIKKEKDDEVKARKSYEEYREKRKIQLAMERVQMAKNIDTDGVHALHWDNYTDNLGLQTTAYGTILRIPIKWPGASEWNELSKEEKATLGDRINRSNEIIEEVNKKLKRIVGDAALASLKELREKLINAGCVLEESGF